MRIGHENRPICATRTLRIRQEASYANNLTQKLFLHLSQSTPTIHFKE